MMKLAIAQMNCLVGDLEGNSNLVLTQAEAAFRTGARLLLTPELSLCGYPPEDLLLRPGFIDACELALQALAERLPDMAVIVGHPHRIGDEVFNAASLLQAGQVRHTYCKQNLPNYAVFDEERYFACGSEPGLFEVDGVRFALSVCADIWSPDVALQAREAGAQILLVANASPYAMGKQVSREAVLRERVAETGMPMLYANLVGGQDELVFDGGSFAMDAAGNVTARVARFDEALLVLELTPDLQPRGALAAEMAVDAEAYRALCVGVRDYVNKNRFPGVLLGLSGGIDSALTLAVAVDALGAEKVRAVMMPSPYTAGISIEDARDMARRLGVRYDELDIAPAVAALEGTLAPLFSGRAADTTEENLQARVRGTLLMALSNKFGDLVLTTGNKSEMAVGYATLYGDMAGGFAVLKDVSKQWVYRLSRYRNTLGAVIPERIIARAPSAELRPDQTDQDSLPPYEDLDAIMTGYVEDNLSIPDLIAAGFREEDVNKVVRLIRINEYKRRQAAVGVRVTERAYGKDWRYPITVRYREDF